ncbi:helix-turn-helix domain-containing protein [Aliivibrio fischeri]|nr:helix-turn-helix domain-containing protein [Aliivibrio fischeri]MUL14853.1 helix-turn-helix domain-containing protein [Aliivibrio fischeri]
MDVMLANSEPHFLRSSILPFELRYSNNSNACYKKHTHREFSIGVVDSGISEYFNQNKKQMISPGSTVIVNPEEVHSCNPQKGTNWSYKMLYVEPEWIAKLQSQILNDSNNTFRPFQITHTDCPFIYRGFQSLAHTLIEDESTIKVEQTALNFFSELILKDTNNPSLDVISKKAINCAYQYISDNFDKNISISEIAEVSGLSDFYLIHSFRKQYGITPHAYQIVMRINKAKALLKNGENIASIATDLGFTDQSHFHRNFKSVVAATPKQYKQSL